MGFETVNLDQNLIQRTVKLGESFHTIDHFDDVNLLLKQVHVNRLLGLYFDLRTQKLDIIHIMMCKLVRLVERSILSGKQDSQIEEGSEDELRAMTMFTNLTKIIDRPSLLLGHILARLKIADTLIEARQAQDWSALRESSLVISLDLLTKLVNLDLFDGRPIGSMLVKLVSLIYADLLDILGMKINIFHYNFAVNRFADKFCQDLMINGNSKVPNKVLNPNAQSDRLNKFYELHSSLIDSVVCFDADSKDPHLIRREIWRIPARSSFDLKELRKSISHQTVVRTSSLTLAYCKRSEYELDDPGTEHDVTIDEKGNDLRLLARAWRDRYIHEVVGESLDDDIPDNFPDRFGRCEEESEDEKEEERRVFPQHRWPMVLGLVRPVKTNYFVLGDPPNGRMVFQLCDCLFKDLLGLDGGEACAKCYRLKFDKISFNLP